jgi:hypothetical protein
MEAFAEAKEANTFAGMVPSNKRPGTPAVPLPLPKVLKPENFKLNQVYEVNGQRAVWNGKALEVLEEQDAGSTNFDTGADDEEEDQ